MARNNGAHNNGAQSSYINTYIYLDIFDAIYEFLTYEFLFI